MTKAEQETLVRWDNEALTLEGWTGDPAVARRWKRLGLIVDVLGTIHDGAPRSWVISLPATAGRRLWVRACAVAIPKVQRTLAGEGIASLARTSSRASEPMDS